MILLTFNLINLEAEFGKSENFSIEERLKITEQNTQTILRNLDIHNVKATFFVDVSLAESLKSTIKAISSQGHEVAFYFENTSLHLLEQTKQNIEAFIEKQVRGIRQKNDKTDIQKLKLLEFSYISNIDNASILFPFKRLERNTEIYEKNGISIIPESISPYSQLPYNDFVFQIMPSRFLNNMVSETLKNEEFVVIYLNSWQFTDFEKYKIKMPFYRKINSGRKMEDKLTSFLKWINENELATSRMKDYLI
jgi:hypothetical protein